MAIDFRESYPVIQWDLNKRTLSKYYIGSVDDSANGYKLQILQDSDILTPSTEEVYFYFEKKDNTRGYIQATILGDYFIVDLTNQVFAIAGDVSCNFQITSNLRWKTSPEFIIKVEDNNIRDSIESTNDFIVFQNALNTLEVIIDEANEVIPIMNQAAIDEALRVENEEDRVANDLVRPIWHYVTQAQYDTLTQEEKDDQKHIYQITDNPDSDLVDELANLLSDINTGLTALESTTQNINNINDGGVNTLQTWSSDKITKRIRTVTYTATSTTSTIPHNLDFVVSTDELIAIVSGVVLEFGDNYTHSADYKSIILNGWTITSGTKVFFRLYKNVK